MNEIGEASNQTELITAIIEHTGQHETKAWNSSKARKCILEACKKGILEEVKDGRAVGYKLVESTIF
jgi:hypothetical protein